MKRRIISFCAIPFILFFIVAFAIIYPVWNRIEYNLHTAGCPSNLKQIDLGIMMYSQDYDGRLPPAIFPGKTVGWANGLQPYVRSYPLFFCPLEEYNEDHPSIAIRISRFFSPATGISKKEIHQPDQPGFTDYWLNSNLAGVRESEGGSFFTGKNKKISNPEQIITLGDGDGKSPQSTASYSIDQIPESWRTSSDSPAKRHLDGANYAFLDGHVKWLRPAQVSQLPPSKKNPVYTFSIQ